MTPPSVGSVGEVFVSAWEPARVLPVIAAAKQRGILTIGEAGSAGIIVYFMRFDEPISGRRIMSRCAYQVCAAGRGRPARARAPAAQIPQDSRHWRGVVLFVRLEAG
jgi:hypothetical protein